MSSARIHELLTAAGLWGLLVLTGAAAAAERAGASAQAARLAATLAPEIAALAERGEYRQAIAKAGDYEQELLALYPAPRYELGLFQAAANHLQFHSPFTDWKRANFSKEEAELFRKLTMAGFDILLALEGVSDQQRLRVFSIHSARMTQRSGSAPGFEFSSDQGVEFIAQMVTPSFGTVSTKQSRTIGDRRVLDMALDTAFRGPQLRLIMLPTKQQVFAFLLAASPSELGSLSSKLDELVKTASFDYQPEDAAAVAAERARGDRDSVAALLRCVERLASRGEFNAAAEDLTTLRHVLHGKLPKPTVDGNVAWCPAYGITLRNPNAELWNLNVQIDGIVQSVVLDDRYSVHGEGLAIGAVDMLVAVGPQCLDLLRKDENAKRETLIGSGRGGATMLGEIEKERLLPMDGQMAYEAIVKLNLPGVKARVQCRDRGDFMLLIVALADAEDFDRKLAQFDAIIAQHAQLGRLTTPTTRRGR